MKKVIVFSGSNSKSSINQKLAVFSGSLMKEIDIRIIELRNFPAPIFSIEEEKKGIPEKIIKLNKLFDECDGFIFSSPEYNGTVTPVFKNTYDWLSRIEKKVFRNKPVLLMSTSPGPRGGMSVLEFLKQIMPRWGGIIKYWYSLPNYFENTDSESGELTNLEEKSKLRSVVDSFKKELDS